MMAFKTATGKEFQTDYFVPHEPSKSLYIRIIDSDINTVREIFTEPEETSLLTYNEREFTGYTQMMGIEQESEALKVRLKKLE